MYNMHVGSCNIALQCPTQQFRHITHPPPVGPAWELMLCRKFDIALMQSIHRNFKTKNAPVLPNEYWHQHNWWPHDQNCKVDQVVLVGFLFYSECLKWSSSEIVRLSKTHNYKSFFFFLSRLKGSLFRSPPSPQRSSEKLTYSLLADINRGRTDGLMDGWMYSWIYHWVQVTSL